MIASGVMVLALASVGFAAQSYRERAATPKAAPRAVEPKEVTKTPSHAGMVWCNTRSKVYHKEGDRWYGKTEHGQWMTEADAIKAGYHEARHMTKE